MVMAMVINFCGKLMCNVFQKGMAVNVIGRNLGGRQNDDSDNNKKNGSLNFLVIKNGNGGNGILMVV